MHLKGSIRQRSLDKALSKDLDLNFVDRCSIFDKKTDIETSGKSSQEASNMNFEKNFIMKLATTTAKASKLVYK